MTATIRNLSVLNYANGYATWHYRALTPPVTLDAVRADGFFDGAADKLGIGDIILVSAADGAAQLYVVGTAGGVRHQVMCATMCGTVPL